MVGPEAGQAVPQITGFSGDGEPAIRVAVVKSLSRIAPQGEGTRLVLDQLNGDENVHVQAAVWEARQRIRDNR
jgi:hypothetical protein